MTTVLLLNSDYSPMRVIPWEDAILKILDHKVQVVVEYADRVIRSTSTEMAFPAVIALNRFAKAPKKVRFNRANILARDGYTCAYCGAQPKHKTNPPRPKLDELTMDHIVPRAQSKNGYVILPWNKDRVAVTSWENVITACIPCNAGKADRTPAEAKMTLQKIPSRPSPWENVLLTLRKTHIPEEWKDYLPPESEWRGYWDVELDPS